MAKREKGLIKRWIAEKGYGFASFGSYDSDVFVHISSLKERGIDFEKINADDRIECEIIQTSKGLECKNTVFLEDRSLLKNETGSGKKNISNSKNKTDEIFYLPADTKDLIDLNICDNLNLLINKYPKFARDKKTAEYSEVNIENAYRYIRGEKQDKNHKNINDIYIKRFRAILDNFQEKNYVIEKTEYATDWRLAIGLGETSIYETSIKLHHVYGFPFIPASGFKGTVRNWVINNYFDGKEDEALEDYVFLYVFGTSKTEKTDEQKGNIIFFDVYPVRSIDSTHLFAIELDIINTHYFDYYQKGMETPPGDYDNPNLVKFLTIKDTTFEFAYGYNKNFILKENTNTKFKNKINETINRWINETLNYQGIGAKTSVGYGYFTIS